MKKSVLILILAASSLLIAGCNKNYYSGTNKGGKNCGCPSQKGL